MSGHYAKDTSVSVEKSRSELESLLRRYGGTAFAYASDDKNVRIRFRITTPEKNSLSVRMDMGLPSPKERRFTHTEAYGHTRDSAAAARMWEQECRALWRALVLVVKAKLEACAIGISTLEHEFFADIVLPNGQTMMQAMAVDVRRLLESGDTEVRLTLPAGSEA